MRPFMETQWTLLARDRDALEDSALWLSFFIFFFLSFFHKGNRLDPFVVIDFCLLNEMAPFPFPLSFFPAVGLRPPRSQREREREREVSVVGKLFGELINSLRDWKKRYYKGRDSSGVWRFFSFNRDLSST